jgi:uncharacterized protein (DUF58 family)
MPKRHGWTALLGAAAAVVTGRLFGLLELYVIGAALALTVLVAWLWVRRRPATFEVRRRVRPALVTAGQPARVELQVINQGRRHSRRAFLWEPVGDRGGAPMQVGRLASGESAAAAYRIPTARRGVVTLGPLWVEQRDPFGLASRSSAIGGTLEVLVLPQVLPIGAPSARGAGALGEHLRMKAFGQTGSEFHGMRQYQSGDDLRRINWKASARTSDLIVTETEPEGLRRCSVVLDVAGYPRDGDEAFERAVSIAASVVRAASDARLRTRFRAPGVHIDGPDVDAATLRYLARITPTDPGAWHAGRGTSHDHLGLIVVIAAAPDGVVERTARTEASPTDTVVLVTTRSVSGGGPFHLDGTSLDAFMVQWATLLQGRGDAARPVVVP